MTPAEVEYLSGVLEAEGHPAIASAFSMRKKGATFAEIARATGKSPNRARQMCLDAEERLARISQLYAWGPRNGATGQIALAHNRIRRQRATTHMRAIQKSLLTEEAKSRAMRSPETTAARIAEIDRTISALRAERQLLVTASRRAHVTTPREPSTP